MKFFDKKENAPAGSNSNPVPSNPGATVPQPSPSQVQPQQQPPVPQPQPPATTTTPSSATTAGAETARSGCSYEPSGADRFGFRLDTFVAIFNRKIASPSKALWKEPSFVQRDVLVGSQGKATSLGARFQRNDFRQGGGRCHGYE